MSRARRSLESRHIGNLRPSAGVLLIVLASVVPAFDARPAIAGGPSSAAAPWTAPGRAGRRPNPIPADVSSVAKGRAIFSGTCSPCHGAAGRGDGPTAAFLQRNGVPVHPSDLTDPALWEQSDGAIYWKISEGRTPMPAFRESLSDEQLWELVLYVRTLAPRPDARPLVPTGGGQ